MWFFLPTAVPGMVLLPYKSMETNTITNKEVPSENNGVKTLPVIVLVMLILAFIGLQAYYMISSIMTP